MLQTARVLAARPSSERSSCSLALLPVGLQWPKTSYRARWAYGRLKNATPHYVRIVQEDGTAVLFAHVAFKFVQTSDFRALLLGFLWFGLNLGLGAGDHYGSGALIWLPNMGGLPSFWGCPVVRMKVYKGVYKGSPIFGNTHIIKLMPKPQ